MADVIRERQYVVDGRRADDIQAHERRWYQSNGLLLALLGLLALALISMFLYDRGRTARTPVIDEPTLPRVDVPVRAPVLVPPPPPAEPEKNLAPPLIPDVEKTEEKKTEEPKTEEKTAEQKAPPPAPPAPVIPAPAKPQQPRQTEPLTADSGTGCKRLSIYFEPQGMNLTDTEKKDIDALADCLKERPGTVVKFEGRSDGVELPNGDTLAKDRAQLLADELAARGVKECRFVVVTGDPTCTENDFACRRQNRSVTVISDF